MVGLKLLVFLLAAGPAIVNCIAWTYYDDTLTHKDPELSKLRRRHDDILFSNGKNFFPRKYQGFESEEEDGSEEKHDDESAHEEEYSDETTESQEPDNTSAVTESHESDTTTPVSTTNAETTENPTTTPVTTPSPECPPDRSLLSEEDIKLIISHVMTEKDVYHEITETYQANAEALNKKYSDELNDFLEWFQNQPEHLKHVLDALAQTRQRITPFVTKITSQLEKLPDLEKSYNSTTTKIALLLQKFNKALKICELNCDQDTLLEPLGQSYCGSVEDVYKKYVEKAQQLVNKTASYIAGIIEKDDEDYSTKIQNLKDQLKDLALKNFGRTMYDILSLQDEYHHYEDLVKMNLEADIFEMSTIYGNVDLKVSELDRGVDKLRHKCLSCQDRSMLLRMLSYNEDQTPEGGDTKEDILDILFQQREHELVDQIMGDYNKIFEDINSKLNDTELEKNLDKLKPIQKDVAEKTNLENEELKKLKGTTSKASIDVMLQLVAQANVLLPDLVKFEEELNKKLSQYN